jgi:hypothetical protein
MHSLTDTHSRTHTHTHSLSHTQTHSCIHSLSPSNYWRTDRCRHSLTHSYSLLSLSLSHTHTHTTQIHSLLLTPAHTQSRIAITPHTTHAPYPLTHSHCTHWSTHALTHTHYLLSTHVHRMSTLQIDSRTPPLAPSLAHWRTGTAPHAPTLPRSLAPFTCAQQIDCEK